jgi:hypothetical protein
MTEMAPPIEVPNLVHPNAPPFIAYDPYPDVRVLDGACALGGTATSVYVRHRDRWVAAHYHSAAIVQKALATMPPPDRRHAAGANLQRRKAGEVVMSLNDVELRAALMDKLDLWSGVFPDASSDFVKPDWLEGAGVVRLRCKSTGRIYCHVVPEECQDYESARTWIMTELAPAAIKAKVKKTALKIGAVST